MDQPTFLLKAALWMYAAGGVGSLLALRKEKLANLVGFGGGTLGGLSGIHGKKGVVNTVGLFLDKNKCLAWPGPRHARKLGINVVAGDVIPR